jgi:hypothetical protein
MTNESKLERINNIKFNRTPVEKLEYDECRGEMISFLNFHKHLLKFVDWTTNTIYLRTDVEQPLYLTDPEGHAKTFEDRTALSLLGEE